MRHQRLHKEATAAAESGLSNSLEYKLNNADIDEQTCKLLLEAIKLMDSRKPVPMNISEVPKVPPRLPPPSSPPPEKSVHFPDGTDTPFNFTLGLSDLSDDEGDTDVIPVHASIDPYAEEIEELFSDSSMETPVMAVSDDPVKRRRLKSKTLPADAHPLPPRAPRVLHESITEAVHAIKASSPSRRTASPSTPLTSMASPKPSIQKQPSAKKKQP